MFRAFVDRHGLPKSVHVHTLRHSAASFLAAAEVPASDIAAQLGHADGGTLALRSSDSESAACALPRCGVKSSDPHDNRTQGLERVSSKASSLEPVLLFVLKRPIARPKRENAQGVGPAHRCDQQERSDTNSSTDRSNLAYALYHFQIMTAFSTTMRGEGGA
jgi:hypothetical protein